MATRFGGASPTHAYSIRMRYIVGCLLLIIIVLLASLLYFVQRKGEEAPTVVQDNTFAAQSNTLSKLDVVVAMQRIEEGAPLDKSMFGPMQWSPEQLPEGVILWKDVDAFIPNRFAQRMISTNMPVTKDAITDVKPTGLTIPPGFRAITITVDARTGVEGWAKPNSRVDVRCIYTDPKTKMKKIFTVAQFVKVLSLGGAPPTAGAEQRAPLQGVTTITLLVEERVGQKVELARNIGELSLALVGNEPTAPGDGGAPISIVDLIKDDGPVAEPEGPPVEGTVVTTDPVTGRRRELVLQNGRLVEPKQPAAN